MFIDTYCYLIRDFTCLLGLFIAVPPETYSTSGQTTSSNIVADLSVHPSTMLVSDLRNVTSKPVKLTCQTVNNATDVIFVQIRIYHKKFRQSPSDYYSVLAITLNEGIIYYNYITNKSRVFGYVTTKPTIRALLSLDLLRCEDAGFYRCKVDYVSHSAKVYTKNATTTLKVAPGKATLAVQPRAARNSVGDNVTLTCTAVIGSVLPAENVKFATVVEYRHSSSPDTEWVEEDGMTDESQGIYRGSNEPVCAMMPTREFLHHILPVDLQRVYRCYITPIMESHEGLISDPLRIVLPADLEKLEGVGSTQSNPNLGEQEKSSQSKLFKLVFSAIGVILLLSVVGAAIACLRRKKSQAPGRSLQKRDEWVEGEAAAVVPTTSAYPPTDSAPDVFQQELESIASEASETALTSSTAEESEIN